MSLIESDIFNLDLKLDQIELNTGSHSVVRILDKAIQLHRSARKRISKAQNTAASVLRHQKT